MARTVFDRPNAQDERDVIRTFTALAHFLASEPAPASARAPSEALTAFSIRTPSGRAFLYFGFRINDRIVKPSVVRKTVGLGT